MRNIRTFGFDTTPLRMEGRDQKGHMVSINADYQVINYTQESGSKHNFLSRCKMHNGKNNIDKVVSAWRDY